MSESTINEPYDERTRRQAAVTTDLDGSGEEPAYLAQEYDTGYDENDLAHKPPVTGTCVDQDDFDFENSAKNRIHRMDEERAATVAKRRQSHNPFQRAFNFFVPYGGLVSSGFNLASSSIGAGIISLPSAFEASGLAMAIVYLVIIGVLTAYSFTLLAIAGKRTGLRNYEQIVYHLLGPGADYFLAFCMWLLSFGAEVSYVISMKDVLTRFIEDSPNPPDYLLTISGQRLLTSMVWLAVMMPLTLPKEINTLRYFSVFAIALIIFFVICMIVHSAQNGLKGGPRDDLIYFQTGNRAIGGLAIFMFAYISQLNMYEVYNEMYKPSVRRVTLGAGLGVFLCFILYFFSGLFGYLDFGPAVTGSALKMYNPVKEPLMGVAYAGIMFKLCVGFGLHMIPVRDAVYHCVKIDVKTIAWWKNACICCLMATLSLICGLFIPRINIVFGLVGGFSGGFIGFIFPSLMFMYTGNWSLKTVGWKHYFGTYFLLIVGVIGVVFGTGSSIYDTVLNG